MRINQYLAQQGHSTRRGADELIKKGVVFINGRKAKLGDQVGANDPVEVRRGGIKAPASAYFAYHKPTGLITLAQTREETDIVKSLPKELQKLKLFPLGRLDKESSGLILLTNDGRVTDRLLNPKYDHEKTYEVKTKLPLRSSFKAKMEGGVDIEGYRTKPAKVQILGEKRFRIAITEGKTHQIRRMVVALFNEVVELKRLSVMNIKLGNLPKGSYRPIRDSELSDFLTSIGLRG